MPTSAGTVVGIAVTPPPLSSWTCFGASLLQASPTHGRSLKVCSWWVSEVSVSPTGSQGWREHSLSSSSDPHLRPTPFLPPLFISHQRPPWAGRKHLILKENTSFLCPSSLGEKPEMGGHKHRRYPPVGKEAELGGKSSGPGAGHTDTGSIHLGSRPACGCSAASLPLPAQNHIPIAPRGHAPPALRAPVQSL